MATDRVLMLKPSGDDFNPAIVKGRIIGRAAFDSTQAQGFP
jgi:hypothetical protein